MKNRIHPVLPLAVLLMAVSCGETPTAPAGFEMGPAFDDIPNNLDTTIDATAEVMSLILGGANGTTVLRVVERNDDGKNGCNLTGQTTLVVSVNSSNPSVATVSPTSVTFDSCGATRTLTVTALAVGSTTISLGLVSNNTAGTFDLAPATFTVNVTSPSPSDVTPPAISYVLNPALPDGLNGWYVSDVTLTWTVTENDSPGSLVKTGCVDQNITSDQVATIYSCSATSDGGSAGPVEVTIKRDATAPSAGASASPAPNGNGWNNTDVTVTFNGTDALSGLASCTAPIVLSADGAGQSATGTCTDNAGNVSADATASGINIDKTAPEVTVTGVTNGATYTLGAVPAAGCSTTDALSGVATDATLGTSGGPVGPIIATCAGATDNAGNGPVSASVMYSVIYDWTGFFSPVDNLPTLNRVKAGSAVPVKFNLGGDQGLNIFEAGFPKFAFEACPASAPYDTIEETVTAGNSSLTYDPVAQQYVYVWKTDKAWAGKCGALKVTLIDGTTHKALFSLTK